MSAAYPPEPWALRGQLYGSVLLVPAADVPVDLPPGCRLVRLAGRAVVGAVWVSYEPGGVLSYRELMTVVLVRHGLRLLPTITHIWVDSEASRDGGRALWGIPKDLARFDFRGTWFSAAAPSGPDGAGTIASGTIASGTLASGTIASGTVRPGALFPVRLPVRFQVAQRLDGRLKVSRVRSTAALSLARATFEASAGGPLRFLRGRRPVLAFVLRDFRMSFGG